MPRATSVSARHRRSAQNSSRQAKGKRSSARRPSQLPWLTLRWWLVEGVFVTVWFLLASAIWVTKSQHVQLFPTVLGQDTSITAQNVFQAVNEERAKEGISTLAWSETLAQAAQTKANDMMARGYWSHITPDGKQPWTFIEATGYSYTVAGENLARNFGSTPSVVSAWLQSPTHRANLLHTTYRETGVAAVRGRMNGQETTLVVQMFATRAEAPVASLAEKPPVLPGEITTTAPQIARWLAPDHDSLAAPQVLGQAVRLDPIVLYRAGMALILGGAVLLLVMDTFHPRHRQKHPRHPLTSLNKHTVHIALLVATLLTVGLAEVGALL